MMRVLSLGWGVQSFTLAAMAALGEIEPIDYAVHADTMHESELTYRFAEKWTPWLLEHGVKVATVKNPTGGIFEILKLGYMTYIPAYTYNTRNDSRGQLNRSCTQRWKIVPIRRFLQKNRNKEQRVQNIIGISLDEFQRMRSSNVKYIDNLYPLIDLRMTRADCKTWLGKNGLEIPPKSSCTFCPYHDAAAWREMKLRGGHDWEEAVKVDKLIRDARSQGRRFLTYIHPARMPLEEIDMRNEADRGQLSLWDDECSGICGV